MSKIKTVQLAAKETSKARRKGKKIGFITGCFDILHEGHIDLFRFAKQHVDFLVVVLDSDEAIKEGKGDSRPIHNINQRAKILSELESVDLVVPIEEKYSFLQKESVESVHDKYRDLINPHFLITTPQADSYWQSKKKRAQKKGIEMLLFEEPKQISTSQIVAKISRKL